MTTLVTITVGDNEDRSVVYRIESFNPMGLVTSSTAWHPMSPGGRAEVHVHSFQRVIVEEYDSRHDAGLTSRVEVPQPTGDDS